MLPLKKLNELPPIYILFLNAESRPGSRAGFLIELQGTEAILAVSAVYP
jgi:hypothetical protein